MRGTGRSCCRCSTDCAILSPVVAARAQCWSLAADRFDLVYSVDVIHHIGPTGRLVGYYEEARRVLKEGGRVCTVTHSEALLRSSTVLSRYFPEAVELLVADYSLSMRFATLWRPSDLSISRKGS